MKKTPPPPGTTPAKKPSMNRVKHQNILKDDEEFSGVFGNGGKDFQMSQRRDAKNIKEILVKSKIKTFTNEEEDPESKPCENHCAC